MVLVKQAIAYGKIVIGTNYLDDKVEYFIYTSEKKVMEEIIQSTEKVSKINFLDVNETFDHDNKIYKIITNKIGMKKIIRSIVKTKIKKNLATSLDKINLFSKLEFVYDNLSDFHRNSIDIIIIKSVCNYEILPDEELEEIGTIVSKYKINTTE